MTRIPPFFANAKTIDDIPAPTPREEAAEAPHKQTGATRRAFLGGSLAAVPATMMAASSMAQGGTTTGPTNATVKTKTNEVYFQEIQRNEAGHVQIVLAAIKSLGGTPRPYPTFQNITTSNPLTLLSMATKFENTGVSAYFGASPYLFNPAVKAVTSSLAFVEAYQSGWLNTLSDQPLVPGGLTYAQPATIAEVVAAVDPFIVSLNDNGEFPPTFSMTPSAQNDLAILNFALLLEYLEATFYFNSVPRVFA